MKKIIGIALAAQLAVLSGCASTPARRSYQSTREYTSQPVYAQPQPSAQSEYNKKILKDGLVGAATGAIAAEASGGKAGKGALIGAGTNVIGNALIDVLTTPPPQPQYVTYANPQTPNTDRIVRKYDSNGNVVSEETFTR